jgi:uncharacterized protein (TIGR03083 family)
VDARHHLRQLRTEARLLGETARTALDAPVPTCPGWTVRECVRHTGSVFRRTASIIELGHAPDEWERRPRGNADLLGWYDDATRTVLRALASQTAGTPTWTWYEPWRQVAFWCRRMAHEVTVHRVDAQLAADTALTPVDDAFALDGVDEILECFLRYRGTQRGLRGNGETVLVEADEQIWGVAFFPGGVDVTPGLVEPDVMVRGVASSVYLWLWGRQPDSVVVIEGAETVAERLRAALASVTQFDA